MDFSEIARTYGSNYRPFKQSLLTKGTHLQGVCQTLVGEFIANRGYSPVLVNMWKRRRRGVVVGRHARGKVNMDGWYTETSRIGATYVGTIATGRADTFAAETLRILALATQSFIALDFDYPVGGHQMCFQIAGTLITLFDPNEGFMDLQRPASGEKQDSGRAKLANLRSALTEFIGNYRVFNGMILSQWQLRNVHSKTNREFLAGLRG